MTTILIVEKPGTIRELNVKVFSEDELFKKAGFKSPDGFNVRATWNFTINNNKYSIYLYGKISGKAGQENKYDFPPPVDSMLFFGACVLIAKCNNAVVDLTSDMWDKAYEHLFGGFEDLDRDDSEEESEEEESVLPKTKNGYEKDGFIVDDDESMDEEYQEPKKSKKRKNREPSVKKEKTQPDDSNYLDVLDCTNELEEEEYLDY